VLRRMRGAATPPGTPAGIPPVDVEGVPMRATTPPPTRRSPQQTTAPATAPAPTRSGASRSSANGAAAEGPGRSAASMAGLGLLMVVCCAGPALVAAGTLGTLAAWLRSPLLLGAAVVVVGAGAAWAVWVMQRRRAGRWTGRGCCPPDNGAGQTVTDPTKATKATKEAPRR
jgi:hypothetical protein